LIVRNIAFEAKRKDILGLFKPFGNLNLLRIPFKLYRGFFFVEMTSYEETETVLKILNDTHFYGRNLNIEQYSKLYWPLVDKSIRMK